jgi:hypothetical protein
MSLRLLNAVTATTSAPSAATDGFALQHPTPGTIYYWIKRWNDGMLLVSGAGTGALTFQGIVWLYSVVAGAWFPGGVSTTVADRGKLNLATTITGTTTLVHAETIHGLSAFERIALQATTLTGTSMTVSAYLVPQTGD